MHTWLRDSPSAEGTTGLAYALATRCSRPSHYCFRQWGVQTRLSDYGQLVVYFPLNRLGCELTKLVMACGILCKNPISEATVKRSNLVAIGMLSVFGSLTNLVGAMPAH